jgi:transposase-like protein
LSKISPEGFRFPAPASGVQVNFCKNIKCTAFGVPETLHRIRKPKGTDFAPGDYIRTGMKNRSRMKCGVCGSYNPLRSNEAIAEEVKRLSGHIYDAPVLSCPNDECDNFGTPVTEPGLYARFGKTPFGTPRWRCNGCRKTFSEAGAPQKRQRKPSKNRDVFMLLMNKSPLRRIAEVTDLDVKSVYGKIALIHRQCRAFVGHREQQLMQGMTLPSISLAIDRQIHVVNWSTQKDRRNVALSAIASADLDSGYVFGFHLNFDHSLDRDALERDAAAIGDLEKFEPYRKHARAWLSQDYVEAIAEAKAKKKKKKTGTDTDSQGDLSAALDAEILNEYEAAHDREDVEVRTEQTANTRLPSEGVQIKDQYTMHGHFQLLAAMLQGAAKVRAYLDQDSGIRAAFLGAFAERVKGRTADAFYVSVSKGLTQPQKLRAVQVARDRLAEAAGRYPEIQGKHKERDLCLALMHEEIQAAKSIGEYDDRWISHPAPNMSEPAKKVCWLTDMDDYTDDHKARLYLKASLHSVDRFFMQARRRLSLAERSITAASTEGRTWYGYSAYRPEHLARALEIFRVFYNYCKAGDDKQTPAMRLGLAKAPIPLEDVLYFAK